jgi:hypothetical protein
VRGSGGREVGKGKEGANRWESDRDAGTGEEVIKSRASSGG